MKKIKLERKLNYWGYLIVSATTPGVYVKNRSWDTLDYAKAKVFKTPEKAFKYIGKHRPGYNYHVVESPYIRI